MHRKKKRIFMVMIMVIIMTGTAGCGSGTKDADQTESSTVAAEDLLTPPEEGGDGEKPEEMPPEKSEAGGEDEQAAGQENGEGEPVSGTEEGNKFHYIKEDKDLYGDICEIGENQFTVTEIYVETDEDGGTIMVEVAEGTGAQEEAPKITVVYDENTKFVKQKIWDGGAGHEEREGSAADLQKGFTAEMNGSYEGDVFHATEILIVEVILN